MAHIYNNFCVLGNFNGPVPAAQGTVLIDLTPDDAEYINVEEQLQSSIREHKDNCGGQFTRFNIVKVSDLRTITFCFTIIELYISG